MKIGFVGYGNMAEALASRWAAYHSVCIGGRNSAKAQDLAQRLGHDIAWGSEADAVAGAEIVVMATRHEFVFDVMAAAGGPAAFEGKTVIDINNPVPGAFDGDFLTIDYDGLSLAEKIQAYAPAASVIKAFNMCQASVWKMPEPVFDGRKLVVLHCGGTTETKAQIVELIECMGCHHADIGELKYARLLEPAAAIVIKLLFSGRDPHTVLNLIQPEVKPFA